METHNAVAFVAKQGRLNCAKMAQPKLIALQESLSAALSRFVRIKVDNTNTCQTYRTTDRPYHWPARENLVAGIFLKNGWIIEPFTSDYDYDFLLQQTENDVVVPALLAPGKALQYCRSSNVKIGEFESLKNHSND